ncbi:DNA-processing protein DprA [Sphingomonas qomolangmaensis]|uniref:DNA-processing protein DprA n=1 Tax=Sphingomonas qomolangmaensis TaxID=2918765 RepID=A0ABY5L8W9_9SPHN|nr:DNA-processing protein DprA [Sphingomonas qomolangmaensis]UUL82154.1 DNA-processing protein DprA [Sphingomonas qomolangmaensis]
MADSAGPGAERFAHLRLIRSPRIGPVSFAQLLARFGSASAALDALPMLAERGGGAPRIADERAVRDEIARVERLGARYCLIGDADYPALLAATETAPPALIVRGDLALLARNCIAMVGARNASAAACRFARQLAHALGEAGVTVISGLARGIDTAAHHGAIESGTVGVIASGIDIAFPPENAELQARVGSQGLLIAEQPPGTEPLARFFPSRNRIIAGCAIGTVVVEAAPRSGSLITARLAAEAGREVMAVPGSPLDPRAQGCNLLIREGATLVQSADDILEAVRPIDPRVLRSPGKGWQGPPPADASDAERRTITALLGPVPVAVDELIRQSGGAPAVVQTVLLELELAGRLERHAGGRVSLMA